MREYHHIIITILCVIYEVIAIFRIFSLGSHVELHVVCSIQALQILRHASA